MRSRRLLLHVFGLVGVAIAVISLADMLVRRPTDGVVPYPYGHEGILVRDVAKGSPAAVAGIRASDRILGIGRRLVKSPAEASRELLRHRIGAAVPYLIERAGEPYPFTVDVRLSGKRLLDSTYLYEAAIGFLFFGIGWMVFRRRPDDEAVSMFFVLCVLFLLFFVCRLRPSSYWWIDIFVQNTGAISLFLLPAVFLHFFLVFPRPKRLHFADSPESSNSARRFQAFLNGSPLLFFLIYAIPPVVFVLDLRRQLLGRPVPLLSGAPLSSWVLLGDYLVLGLAALAHSAFTLENPQERRQVMQVFAGTIGGTTPLLVFGIIFPSALHNDSYVFWGIAPMILIPLTFAYAIVRYQMLNVRIIVRKSLLYTASTAVVFALYAGAIAAANAFFAGSRLASSKLFLFGIFLVVIPLFEFLRRKLQTPVDKLFFREKYDYQKAIFEISEAVAAELDMSRIADYLTTRIPTLMRLSGADLYLRTREGTFAARGSGAESVRARSDLALFLRGSSGPRDASILRGDLWSDRESRQFLDGLLDRGVRMLVPFVYREKLMGFLALKGKLSEEDFGPEDRLLLETLANQAAAAIETASLHVEMTQQAELRRDLEIARDIQTGLFPRTLPESSCLRFAAGSLPARVVGGDFYDFLPFEEGGRLGFVMGDVSGKSIPASLLMVASREILYAGSRTHSDPGALFRESNRRIYDIKQRMFVALGYFLIETETLAMRYAIGGQPLPMLLRPGNGGPVWLDPPTYRIPLGAFREVPYDTREVFLKPGDLVLFYTDGFTEAMDANMEPFGEERLMASFQRHAESDLDRAARGILGDVRRHVGEAEQYDDMTFMLMSVVKGTE